METETGNPENDSIEDEIANNIGTDSMNDATSSAAQFDFSQDSIEITSASNSFETSTPLSRSSRIMKVLITLRLSLFLSVLI